MCIAHQIGQWRAQLLDGAGAVFAEGRPHFPFAGARMLRRLLLRRADVDIGRRHVTTLVRRMGITAIAPQPGTSRGHGAHPVFPYLLRGRAITRPNQVWAMDITTSRWRGAFSFSPR